MTTDEPKSTSKQATECPPTPEEHRAIEESPQPPELEPSLPDQVTEPEENEAPMGHEPPSEVSIEQEQFNQTEKQDKEVEQESSSWTKDEGKEARSGAVELEAREAPTAATIEPRTPIHTDTHLMQSPPPEHEGRIESQSQHPIVVHRLDEQPPPGQSVFRGPVPSPTPPPEDLGASPKHSTKYPSTPGQVHTTVGSNNGSNNNHLPPTPPPSAPRITEERPAGPGPGIRSVSLGSRSSASCASTPRTTSGSHSQSAAAYTAAFFRSGRAADVDSIRSRSTDSDRLCYQEDQPRSETPRPTPHGRPRSDSDGLLYTEEGDGSGDLPYVAVSGFRLDTTRLGALDKAQRFWELQNDVSTEGGPSSEKEARLEMLGRDLISDLHSLIEGSVALENVYKDDRLRVWTTGAVVAAGIPTFCFLTQYPSLPHALNASNFVSTLSSLPAKTISTLHSIPAHPVSQAAGRAATQAFQSGRQAFNSASTTASNLASNIASSSSSINPHQAVASSLNRSSRAAQAAGEGLMALSAATLALSLVPTAIGAIEVAMHERRLGDVQSWTEDLRHLCKVVSTGDMVDGMDLYCLTDERWDELPWKKEEEDMRDLCY